MVKTGNFYTLKVRAEMEEGAAAAEMEEMEETELMEERRRNNTPEDYAPLERRRNDLPLQSL